MNRGQAVIGTLPDAWNAKLVGASEGSGLARTLHHRSLAFARFFASRQRHPSPSGCRSPRRCALSLVQYHHLHSVAGLIEAEEHPVDADW